jgi:hypothetical protein
VTTFIPDIAKNRFQSRRWRPVKYTPAHQRLATIIAAMATILALVDWALNDLPAAISHIVFAAAVFGAVRFCVGLSLAHRSSNSDDDAPEEVTP